MKIQILITLALISLTTQACTEHCAWSQFPIDAQVNPTNTVLTNSGDAKVYTNTYPGLGQTVYKRYANVSGQGQITLSAETSAPAPSVLRLGPGKFDDNAKIQYSYKFNEPVTNVVVEVYDIDGTGPGNKFERIEVQAKNQDRTAYQFLDSDWSKGKMIVGWIRNGLINVIGNKNLLTEEEKQEMGASRFSPLQRLNLHIAGPIVELKFSFGGRDLSDKYNLSFSNVRFQGSSDQQTCDDCLNYLDCASDFYAFHVAQYCLAGEVQIPVIDVAECTRENYDSLDQAQRAECCSEHSELCWEVQNNCQASLPEPVIGSPEEATDSNPIIMNFMKRQRSI